MNIFTLRSEISSAYSTNSHRGSAPHRALRLQAGHDDEIVSHIVNHVEEGSEDARRQTDIAETLVPKLVGQCTAGEVGIVEIDSDKAAAVFQPGMRWSCNTVVRYNINTCIVTGAPLIIHWLFDNLKVPRAIDLTQYVDGAVNSAIARAFGIAI